VPSGTARSKPSKATVADYFVPAISFAWEAGAYESPVDSFEFGLQRILDGIEARLGR
jgi:hypothetical protein